MALRFSPAGAGNVSSSMERAITSSVQPRGCGERFRKVLSCTRRDGSAPRVRGTQKAILVLLRPLRFSPAGAGNASARAWRFRAPTVQPRGCGERQHKQVELRLPDGSAPRVRGTSTLHQL